jgi:hypothetical protein
MELLTERDHGAGDGPIALVAGEIRDEGAVDLQARNRKALQRAQARIAGAEVVDRQPHAEHLQFLHRRDRLLDVLHDQAFGQLELEAPRIEAAVPQRPHDLGDHGLLAELPGRDVDADADRRQACILPCPVLPASLAQDPIADRHDEARLLRHRNEPRGRDRPERRMIPADQRFDCKDFAGAQVELRLVEEEEFGSGDALA